MQVKGKPVFYCNIAKMDGVSINDFRIGLGIKKEVFDPANEEDIDFYVIASPQHLKSFVLMLMEHIKIYEKIFGEINLQPNKEELQELSNTQKCLQ